MKTVLILAGLVALSLAGTNLQSDQLEFKQVDADFVLRQKKVLSFFENVRQLNPEAEYYRIGMEYDIQAHKDSYTNQTAVNDFLLMYNDGFLPKHQIFSVFYPRMREEAKELFRLFYIAKDFDTFYNTAAFARVHLNEYQFFYSFYIALMHRPDTQGIVVPAPYEVYPEFFLSSEIMYKINGITMQGGIFNEDQAHAFGIIKRDNDYVFYANYSYGFSYDNEEQRLSYFTEDVGLNAYYYYYHSYFPFWMDGEYFIMRLLNERRGEVYYYYYQQLLARYYLERLSNGLGEIPEFSYYKPINTPYIPLMTHVYYPFTQRHDYHHQDSNINDIHLLDTYEKTFMQYLLRGHVKAFNQEVDFTTSKAMNFISDYFRAIRYTSNYYCSYEGRARQVLSATLEPIDKYTIVPTPLNFYQTALRDPMFYQLYSRIIKYFLMYKEYLKPYTQENLHYVGVKINDVHVDKLVTFFDHYEFDVTNAVVKNLADLKTMTPRYKVSQPRLNNRPFSITIDVKSDVTADAIVKVFMAPKYDSKGYPYSLEDNYMNFVELDYFVYNLKNGQNKIVRKSDEFLYFKDDSFSIPELYKLLEQSKLPVDMSEEFYNLPRRLMLPKGTYGGFPVQFFVMVYPQKGQKEEYKKYGWPLDNKPLGYPFDRPIKEEVHFLQPNMFFRDVNIYFKGERFPYTLNNPFYVPQDFHEH